jgi:hypothetical protein
MSVRTPLLLCLSVLSSSTYAVDAGIAPLGFSGALSTPTAATLSTGQAAIAFSPYLDGQGIDVDGYNYLAGAGLISGLEVFGRLASNTVANHCYTESCGLRDLSASVKFRLPDLLLWLNQPRPIGMPDLAVGATDLGGAATNFRSYYGVATWDQSWWAMSLGMARATNNKGVQARLDGPFASLVAQPLPWLQGILEYDGQDAQAGIRLISPKALLPMGIQTQAEVRTGAAQDGSQSRDVWWGVSAKIPLGLTSSPASTTISDPSLQSQPPARLIDSTLSNHADNGADVSVAPLAYPSTSIPPLNSTTRPAQQPAVPSAAVLASAATLANQLEQHGFQNIRVGYGQERWIVAVENQAYEWNTLDALGVALGVFQQWAGQSTSELTLIIEQQEQPVLTVDTDQRCLTAWLQHGEVCAGGVLRTSTSQADLQGWQRVNPLQPDHRPWLVRQQAPMRWQPKLSLAPVLSYAIGTEYGSMDYSVGLASTIEMPILWSGLMADLRYISVLDESKDYQAGGVFESSALVEGVDRAMLHQYLQGPSGLSAHIALGQMYHDYRGGLLEGQWHSHSGTHQLSLLAGGFEQTSSDRSGRPLVAGYRYQLPTQDIQLGVKAGEFFDGDQGYLLDSRFAFGDTFLTLFFQSSKHPSESSAQSYAGVQLSLPLGMRQNKPLRYGQVGGTAEYSQSIQTEINDHTNSVIGANQHGRLASAPQSLDLQLYNRDRLSVAYINQHMARIREAYQRYVVKAN